MDLFCDLLLHPILSPAWATLLSTSAPSTNISSRTTGIILLLPMGQKFVGRHRESLSTQQHPQNPVGKRMQLIQGLPHNSSRAPLTAQAVQLDLADRVKGIWCPDSNWQWQDCQDLYKEGDVIVYQGGEKQWNTENLTDWVSRDKWRWYGRRLRHFLISSSGCSRAPPPLLLSLVIRCNTMESMPRLSAPLLPVASLVAGWTCCYLLALWRIVG